MKDIHASSIKVGEIKIALDIGQMTLILGVLGIECWKIA